MTRRTRPLVAPGANGPGEGEPPVSAPDGDGSAGPPPRGPVLLAAEGLVTGFGAHQVLFGVELEVRAGEIVGVFGLNGAGKSVTLRTIAGLVEAWDGRVLLEGRDITHLPAEQRVAAGLGHVPQGRQVFADLTVEENLRVGAYTSRRRDRAGWSGRLERIYARFGVLAGRRHTLAGALSGGQRASLAIARALINEPRVLLIDEPTAGLSPALVAELGPLLQGVTSDGTGVLLVEQNVGFGLSVCSTAVVLQTGRVVHAGPTASLDHDRIAALLGIGSLLGPGPRTVRRRRVLRAPA